MHNPQKGHHAHTNTKSSPIVFLRMVQNPSDTLLSKRIRLHKGQCGDIRVPDNILGLVKTVLGPCGSTLGPRYLVVGIRIVDERGPGFAHVSGEVVIALRLVQEGIDGAVLFVVSETERIVEYLGWECQHASMLLPSE